MYAHGLGGGFGIHPRHGGHSPALREFTSAMPLRIIYANAPAYWPTAGMPDEPDALPDEPIMAPRS